MEAATWTAIAILAGSVLGTLFYLGARIDSLGERIDSLGARLDGRIDALASRLDARIDSQTAEIRDLRADLTARLDDHIRRHAG